jgi:hypothetical protein
MLYLDVNGMLYPVTLLPEIVKGVVSFVLYAILNCQDIESGPFFPISGFSCGVDIL